MTHVYLLVGDGWAYPGRSVDPSRRIQEHLAGKCKTTAPRIAAEAKPPIMVPMEDYDFDLDDIPEPNGETLLFLDTLGGKYIPEGYEVLGIYPYYSKETHAIGVAAQKRNNSGFFAPGFSAIGLAAQRKNRVGLFDPSARARGHATMRKNRTGLWNPNVRLMGSRKGVETNRKNKTGLFDPVVQELGRAATRGVSRHGLKGRETQRRNGTGIFDPATRIKGSHIRWHVNRGTTNLDCDLCSVLEENRGQTR